MKFARWTFLIAGVYGLVVLVPQYFVEMGGTTVAGLPEFFYGFLGVAAAFQIVFIIISTDPRRYRLMILPSIVEKFSFAAAVAILAYSGRTSGAVLIGAALDLLLGVLFTASWFKTAPARE